MATDTKATFSETRIQHHGDGSHTVEHVPHMKSSGKAGAFMERGESTTYSAKNTPEMMAKIGKHLGFAGHDGDEDLDQDA